MKKHAAPIIAAILLLLPVLYVWSYLAPLHPRPDNMEQIDRKVRPGAW